MGSSALEEAVRSGSAGERERWGAGALGSGGASGQEASSLRRHGTLRGGLRPRFMRLGGVRLGGVRGAWSLAWRPALAPALGGGPGNLAPGTWRRESGAWQGRIGRVRRTTGALEPPGGPSLGASGEARSALSPMSQTLSARAAAPGWIVSSQRDVA